MQGQGRAAVVIWKVMHLYAAQDSFTTRTGHLACSTTRSAVLPGSKCLNPVQPCDPIIMRSTRQAGGLDTSRRRTTFSAPRRSNGGTRTQSICRDPFISRRSSNCSKRIFFYDLSREPLQYLIGSHFTFHV